MVNLVEAMKPLSHGLMKKAGIVPQVVEIEAGTVINIWVPQQNKTSNNKTTVKPTKPVVVLVHGFGADGSTTWQFQVGSLRKKYAVYVPDLLFFGGSTTDSPDRSPAFQAECLAKGLRKLGVERCTVVGFSYGGTVAFKMAELQPELVEAVAVSGSVVEMTESISTSMLDGLWCSSFSELLQPESVETCKALLKIAMHKKFWLPNCLCKDVLEAMFKHAKEKAELLENFVVRTKDTNIPNFSQRILLLWGEQDQLIKQELAQNMIEELGDTATYQGIKKAGHLVHLERPFVYNRCLKQFLASLHSTNST